MHDHSLAALVYFKSLDDSIWSVFMHLSSYRYTVNFNLPYFCHLMVMFFSMKLNPSTLKDKLSLESVP